MSIIRYEVKITPSAKTQMRQIRDYYAKESGIDDAKEMMREIHEATDNLSWVAGVHDLVKDEPWRSQNIQMIPTSKCNVFYWTDSETSIVYVIAAIYVSMCRVNRQKGVRGHRME